jgi:hypothetical protein
MWIHACTAEASLECDLSDAANLSSRNSLCNICTVHRERLLDLYTRKLSLQEPVATAPVGEFITAHSG